MRIMSSSLWTFRGALIMKALLVIIICSCWSCCGVLVVGSFSVAAPALLATTSIRSSASRKKIQDIETGVSSVPRKPRLLLLQTPRSLEEEEEEADGGDSQGILNPQGILEKLQNENENDTEGEYAAAAASDNDIDEHDHAFTVSKSKWKKKRYLMLQDVRNSIKLGHKSAVRRAEEMISRWWKLYEYSDHDETFRPTVEAYNLWMNAVAKSGLANAGSLAEEILAEMVERGSSSSGGLVPNIVTYTTVMDAYARQSKQGDANAAAHAERVLFDLIRLAEEEQQQQQQHPDRQLDLHVTSVTCDTVLNAWAQQGTWRGAERAEEILNRLEQMSHTNDSSSIRPTEYSYAAVIQGWASCRGGGQAATRAQNVLNRMLLQQGTTTSTTNEKQKGKTIVVVRPDTVVFNACINAWATSRDPQAGSKAVQLLNQMQELHAKKGYDCAPDTVTFNSVLSAWSHSGHINAASQAEKVLQEMLTAHRQAPDTAPAPCTMSHNNVLNAWSKSKLDGAAKRAEAILEFMIKSKQEEIAPDVYSFTSVLDALAKSKEPDKAVRARALLDSLLDMYETTHKPSLRPSQIPFNTVINAAAFSASGTTDEQQRAALQVAVQTFTLMRTKHVAPDSISYGNLLKAFNNLMPPGPTRTKMSLNIFQKCCEEGHVGNLVWNEVRRAVPAKQLGTVVVTDDKLPAGKSIRSASVRDLPRDWRRNVAVDRKQGAPPPNKKLKSKKDNEQEVAARRRAPIRRFRNISEASYQSGRDL